MPHDSKKKNPPSKKIKDLFLDKETTHGGWPEGHSGSWIDKTPVNVQISNYLKSMGLLEDPDHARLSESQFRNLIRNLLIEMNSYDREL